MPRLLTLPEAADRLGVREWQLRRCITRGFAPTIKRFGGRYFTITLSDMPALKRALQRAGYLATAELALNG